MGRDVFISHCDADAELANEVCRSLEAEGIDCWIAPRDILPATSWAEAIMDAIETSRLLLVILSEHSSNSAFVKRELERATARNVAILPFRTEDVALSREIEFYIGGTHRLDGFRLPGEQRVRLLVTKVAELLKKTAEPDEQAGVSMENRDPREPGGSSIEADAAAAAPGPSPQKQSAFEAELKYASEHLAKKEFASCIRECGDLFEKAHRHLLDQLTSSAEFGPQVRDALVQGLAEVGGASQRASDLDLAQLVSLFRKADLFTYLRRYLTSNLHKISRINWQQVVAWRGMAQNAPDDLDQEDAREMVYWLKVFLYDCELVGVSPTIPPIPKDTAAARDCAGCGKGLEEEWRYCPKCGLPARLICEACQRELNPTFRICPYCETRVRLAGQNAQDKSAQHEYRVLCVGAYLDGFVNKRERMLLNKKRLELGLSNDEAEMLEQECAPRNVVEYMRVVEGAMVDGCINAEEQQFLDGKAEVLGLDPWLAEQVTRAVVEIAESPAPLVDA